MRSISTDQIVAEAKEKLEIQSQSHRFSEVYFHSVVVEFGMGFDDYELSQSHRFSEVYFHTPVSWTPTRTR